MDAAPPVPWEAVHNFVRGLRVFMCVQDVGWMLAWEGTREAPVLLHALLLACLGTSTSVGIEKQWVGWLRIRSEPRD